MFLPSEFQVEAITIHPEFRFINLQHDLAVLKVKGDLSPQRKIGIYQDDFKRHFEAGMAD